MSQEIKLMVRPDIGGRQSVVEVEREFAYLSDVQGWKLHATFHLGMEKSGSHNVMFVLVRDVEKVVAEKALVSEPVHAGRPKKLVE